MLTKAGVRTWQILSGSVKDAQGLLAEEEEQQLHPHDILLLNGPPQQLNEVLLLLLSLMLMMLPSPSFGLSTSSSSSDFSSPLIRTQISSFTSHLHRIIPTSHPDLRQSPSLSEETQSWHKVCSTWYHCRRQEWKEIFSSIFFESSTMAIWRVCAAHLTLSGVTPP